ncbi:MAG: tetratricopeptide repeat protein [Planctomycetaceae bacterium]|nr:tetratricopeptide repeat protein [Planctomycetaceae bacterium]
MFRLRLRIRGVRRVLALGLAVSLVFGLAQWRAVYVLWQIRAARVALRLGDTEDVQRALLTLEAALGVERPDRPELLYLLARAQRRAGDLDEALAGLRRAEKSGWPAGQVQEQRRLAAMQRGRFEDPGHSLDKLLRQDASDESAYEVYEAMAKGYLHSYRFSDALHCLDFWIEWRPAATDPRMWRAGIWGQVQNWQRANDDYRAILHVKPAHRAARLALAGNLLMQMNQANEAHREFLLCLAHSPGDVEAVLGIAACERQLADPQSAERRLALLLERELTPDQRASVQLELGQILLERRDTVEAIRLLEQVVVADPLSRMAHYALGQACAAGGERERAAGHFDRSRVLGEQLDRLTDITTALISHPEKVDLRFEAGRILMDQGMHLEGAAWMSTALMYDANHQKTHAALAGYYETVKHDRRLAEHHRKQALRAERGGLH